MTEILLQREGEQVRVMLGDQQAQVQLVDLVPTASTWRTIKRDAEGYGQQLFKAVFPLASMRSWLTDLPSGYRLALCIHDSQLASVPWEYLRDERGKLLAARVALVRVLPDQQRRAFLPTAGPLHLVAVPVSPVDEPLVLNVEGEWRHLLRAVTKPTPPRELTLTRVRPPTTSRLERVLAQPMPTIVHFMGQGTLQAGRAFVSLEDARGCTRWIDAADLADMLPPHVLLTVLNSCHSSHEAPTPLSNIARVLVERGCPYALGMQYIIPDKAALLVAETLYDVLLQGQNVEQAVMHLRRALLEPGRLSQNAWLAGLPVLYSSLREPAPPLSLALGQPLLQPDPRLMERTCDVSALPQAAHFLGRGDAMRQALAALLAPDAHGLVLVRGLGGIGKTALARVVAERVSWYYEDRVLAVSFETFARLDEQQGRVVDATFLERFLGILAHFYGLDTSTFKSTTALQQAILQQRTYVRSLLVLDNLETLFDAQFQKHPVARTLAGFVRRLQEGDGVVLCTSRMQPPADAGSLVEITLSGLADEAGAALFRALLPDDRVHEALEELRRALSHQVGGHPLSLRLLASRFADESVQPLDRFLQHIAAELKLAEQTTPESLEDPERQRTLYACLDGSIKRLTPDQQTILRAIGLFQGPFLADDAAALFEAAYREQVLQHVQTLVRLSLLEQGAQSRVFAEGTYAPLELHPMVRWYLQHQLPAPEAAQRSHYAALYLALASQAHEAYGRNALLHFRLQQSLPECEAALRMSELTESDRSQLAYYLARAYHRLGQPRRALELYEQSLATYQALCNVRGIAVMQHAMANVLAQQGKPQEAMKLYEQSLVTYNALSDVRSVAVTQSAMANVLLEQGKPEEAMKLYEQSLATDQGLGDVRGVAVTQQAMADVLMQQGKPEEAMKLYEQSLATKRTLGDVRGVAVTQNAMANVLTQQGKPQEAMKLYKQVLEVYKGLGDVRSVAVTQNAMAGVLTQQGKPEEAMKLYEQSLATKRTLGDVRGVAVTQNAMANVLTQQGKAQEAMKLYEQSLATKQALGDVREVAVTQHAMAGVLTQQGKPQEAMKLYEQSLATAQALGDVRGVAATQKAIANVLAQQGKPQEAMKLYEQSLAIAQGLGDVRSVAATQKAMAGVLTQQGKPQEAMKLYEQSLAIAQGLGDVRSVAATQQAIANVLTQQGKPQEAMKLYEQSLAIAQGLGDVRSVAVTQKAIADVLAQQGKLEEAMKLYEQSLVTKQALGDVRSVAVTQKAIADVLAQQGKLEEAMKLYEQSLVTKQALGDVREVALTQHAMAGVLAQQGKLEEAKKLYEQSLTTKQALGDVREVALTQHAIADVLAQQGKLEEAMKLYEQVLEVYKGLGDVRGVAVTQQAMADVLKELKRR